MADEEAVQEIAKHGEFTIVPAPDSLDISTRQDYTRLNLNDNQKIQLAALSSQLPAMLATETLQHGYFLEFPKGVQGTLMKLRSGGYSTVLVNENHRFVGTASLRKMDSQVIALGAFSAMAVVSGQYFLSEINNNLKMMKLNLDKILEFLYGDKKAELMSEMSFVKYAYQNYTSIMSHEPQRLATIISLQEARKVAMKDIEFYMHDLDSTINVKSGLEINDLVDKAFQIRDSLELSVQLCVVSSLLEVYYSENYDQGYLQYVEKDLTNCIDKWEKQILGSFAGLNQTIQLSDGKPFRKSIDSIKREEVTKIIEGLKGGTAEEPPMKVYLHAALSAPIEKHEYYIGDNGVVYLKTA